MLDLAPYDPITTSPDAELASWHHDAAGIASTVCRLVVADDHPVYRDGIVRALQRSGGFAIVGEAENGIEALDLIRRLQPDLALLDVRMPLLDGVDVVHALALHGPDVPVVMLSAFSDRQLVASALEAGAAGYIGKGEDRDALCERLRVIAEHGDQLVPSRLSPHDPLGVRGEWLPRLTSPEHQLLQLAGHGLDKRELADALHLTELEVRRRAVALARKLDADSLADAVVTARMARLIR